MITLPAPDSLLEDLVTPVPLGDGRFSVTFPDGWQQGRGAFGGLVLAALVRVVEAVAEPGRTLRSLTAEICGPVQPGEAILQTEILRAGSAVSTIAARLLQAGEVQAHVVGVLGKQRATDCDEVHLTVPKQTHWKDLPLVPVGPPFGPDFGKFYEFRSTGAVPFLGISDRKDTSGWIRPRHANVRDAAWVVACADAWWPALFTQVAVPRPMATVAFTLQLLCDTTTLPDAPLQFFGRTLVVNDGYVVEHRELWSEDGRLVALNEQTIAVIK